MFCSNCGKVIPDNARFCNNCGAAVVEGAVEMPAPKKPSPESAVPAAPAKPKSAAPTAPAKPKSAVPAAPAKPKSAAPTAPAKPKSTAPVAAPVKPKKKWGGLVAVICLVLLAVLAGGGAALWKMGVLPNVSGGGKQMVKSFRGLSEEEIVDLLPESCETLVADYVNEDGYIDYVEDNVMASSQLVYEFAEKLVSAHYIEDATIQEECGTVAFFLKSGAAYLYIPKINFTYSGDYDVVSVETLDWVSDTVITGLDQVSRFHIAGSVDAANCIANRLEDYYNHVTVKSSAFEDLNDIAAWIEGLEDGANRIILWRGHGTAYTTRDGQTVAVWITHIKKTKDDENAYSAEIEAQSVLHSDGYYALSETFFDEHLTQVDGGLFYSGSCETGKGNAKNIFLNHGFGAYMSPDGSVWTTYGDKFMGRFCEYLCGNVDGALYSLEQAYKKTKEDVGENDIYGVQIAATDMVLDGEGYHLIPHKRALVVYAHEPGKSALVKDCEVKVTNLDSGEEYEVELLEDLSGDDECLYRAIVPTGNYQVEVTCEGYCKQLRQLAVEDNERLEIEMVNIEDQLKVIMDNEKEWNIWESYVMSSAVTYFITDMNQNGLLEINAMCTMGSGIFSELRIYEVNRDMKTLTVMSDGKDESSPDMFVDALTRQSCFGGSEYYLTGYYDDKTTACYYISCDLMRSGVFYSEEDYFLEELGTERKLIGGRLKEADMKTYEEKISFFDADLQPITEEKLEDLLTMKDKDYVPMKYHIEARNGYSEKSVKQLLTESASEFLLYVEYYDPATHTMRNRTILRP